MAKQVDLNVEQKLDFVASVQKLGYLAKMLELKENGLQAERLTELVNSIQDKLGFSVESEWKKGTSQAKKDFQNTKTRKTPQPTNGSRFKPPPLTL